MDNSILALFDLDPSHVDRLFSQHGRRQIDLTHGVQSIRDRYLRLSMDPTFRHGEYRCAYCGADLLADLNTFLAASRDHIVPRSRGGHDGFTNKVPCCYGCNQLKGDQAFPSLGDARAQVLHLRRQHQAWFEHLLLAAYR